jgi:DNA-binding CsgD family transcriptional regulator
MNFGESHPGFEGGEPIPRLTRREREILGLILARKRDKEIAAQLGISLRTIEKHVELLRCKLAVRSRREIRGRQRPPADSEDPKNT